MGLSIERGKGRNRAWRPRVEALETRALLSGGPLDARADFDGDGITDPAVFRPSTAQWFLRKSTEGLTAPAPIFGATQLYDFPIVGDFDGDGRDEPGVFRPTTAEWFALGPKGGYNLGRFGATNLLDIPVPADYDGDGTTDLAVFRVTTGEWFALGPTGGYRLGFFGDTHLRDIPAPGDFDGDGRDEPAVFRVATAEWFHRPNGVGQKLAEFGGVGLMDTPAPGDYDGDGRDEPAVFRLGTGEWFTLTPDGGRRLFAFGGGNGYDFAVESTGAALGRLGYAYFPSVLSPSDVPYQRLDAEAVALHESFVTRAQSGPTPIVLLGDSILGRWGTAAGGFVGKTSWDNYLAPLGASNFSVTGDTTQNVIWRVQNGELAGRPRIVVISIGTNNLGTSADVNSSLRGISAVLTAVRTAAPDAKILLLGVLPRGNDANSPMRTRIADLNSRFAGFRTGTDVRFLDLGPFLTWPDGTLIPGAFSDGLHPAELGYRIIGQALRAALDIMLGT